MNDTAKSLTKLRVLNAMKEENLSNKEAADAIGIPGNYLSMIKNPKQWPKCPAKAWEAALRWVNSGQRLLEYKEKHGKIRPKPEPKEPTGWHTPTAVEFTKLGIDPHLLPPEAEKIKTDPEQHKPITRRQTEQEFKKMLDGIPPVTAPLKVEKAIPPEGDHFTDTARLKVCLDVEINLVVNGKRVNIR